MLVLIIIIAVDYRSIFISAITLKYSRSFYFRIELITGWSCALFFSSTVAVTVVVRIFIPYGIWINGTVSIITIKIIAYISEWTAKISTQGCAVWISISVPIHIRINNSLTYCCCAKSKKQKSKKLFHNLLFSG